MTLKTRLLPAGQDYGATDDPIEAKAWKNIVFDVNGGSHLCNPIYSTEGEAKAVIDQSIADIQLLCKEQLASMKFHDGSLFVAISHSVQIPWNRP